MERKVPLVPLQPVV